jgi:type I restriction enzyme S subunit
MPKNNLTLSAYCVINPPKEVPEKISVLDLVSFIPMQDVSATGDWATKQTRQLLEVQNGFTSFKNKDVLVAKITPCFENGKGALVDDLIGDVGFGSTEFHILRAKEDADPRFIFHLSQWKRFRVAALQFMSGSAGQQRVASEFFYKYKVEEFNKKEQSVISDILDRLDGQIHKSEAIIAKLQQVKQGLLHDLLTRGVDGDGELRPSYGDAPELYKPSELGLIPKDWDVVNVGSQITIKHGFAFDGSLFTADPVGYPLLVPGNFHRDGRLYFTTKNTKYYKGKYSDEYLLEPSDIVVVMTDLSPQTLILGRAAILDDSQWLLHNQRIGKIEFKYKDEWDKRFFVESISQEAVRRKVIITATGTTVRHTSPDRIYALDIAKPLINEQRLIDEIIENAWERLNKESDQLRKLKLQKSGLMDDLLTGKVRVTKLINQQQAS